MEKLLNEFSIIWQHSLVTLMQLGQPKNAVEVTQVDVFTV